MGEKRRKESVIRRHKSQQDNLNRRIMSRKINSNNEGLKFGSRRLSRSASSFRDRLPEFVNSIDTTNDINDNNNIDDDNEDSDKEIDAWFDKNRRLSVLNNNQFNSDNINNNNGCRNT